MENRITNRTEQSLDILNYLIWTFFFGTMLWLNYSGEEFVLNFFPAQISDVSELSNLIALGAISVLAARIIFVPGIFRHWGSGLEWCVLIMIMTGIVAGEAFGSPAVLLFALGYVVFKLIASVTGNYYSELPEADVDEPAPTAAHGVEVQILHYAKEFFEEVLVMLVVPALLVIIGFLIAGVLAALKIPQGADIVINMFSLFTPLLCLVLAFNVYKHYKKSGSWSNFINILRTAYRYRQKKLAQLQDHERARMKGLATRCNKEIATLTS